jgi:DNA-binding transcriptional LysR family regulator
MDLEELRAFLAIVQTGSFLAAASDLGVSRGMLRRRVDALEARVGARLVERSPKGVVTTDAGALLAAQGRRLVQSSSALLQAVREVAGEPAGELRVGLPVGLPPHVLVPVLALLRGTMPRVRLELRVGPDPFGRTLDEIDVALCFGEQPLGDAWVAHELLRVPVRLLAQVDYLRHRGTPKAPEDLREHALLAWAGPGLDPTRWPLHDGSTLAVAPQLVGNDAHMLREATLGGLGIALLPDAKLPEPPGAAALVRVLEGVVGCALPLRLVVPVLLAGSPKVAKIVATAQKFVGRL